MTNTTDPNERARELKPCPFCGNCAPYLYSRDGTDNTVAVRCATCGVTTADFKSDRVRFSGNVAAIAAWNRRALSHAAAADPYERGLETPRRVAAVETLLAQGWKWIDGKWAAPAAVPAGEAVAYLDIGVGGYLDLGTEKDADELFKLPPGRHMLGIIGTYGVDGYKANPPADGEAGAALYGMFRALVDAGGATTVARHGAMPRPEKLMDALTRGMLAIERMFHPERFELDEFPSTAARPPAPVQATPPASQVQQEAVDHIRTGVFDKNGVEICAGDRIVIRLCGEHTKPEYWNPEYVVVWKAPCFGLEWVGGGKSSDTATWYWRLGTPQGYEKLELVERHHPAAGDKVRVTDEMVDRWCIYAYADMGWPQDFSDEALVSNREWVRNGLEVAPAQPQPGDL